ncbi:hypothetical protein BXZ70DRAFT_908810 [Cristinia sonorae]|uniref:Uncharacterized protein n=1 Tax=Cristinia sonorae TaxID=1940300 RepID=A0A8K0UJB1_9AGAR|nr:hypothetical protein BXZ70DRAFT_908810 [Cristinia sonorae]
MNSIRLSLHGRLNSNTDNKSDGKWFVRSFVPINPFSLTVAERKASERAAMGGSCLSYIPRGKSYVTEPQDLRTERYANQTNTPPLPFPPHCQTNPSSPRVSARDTRDEKERTRMRRSLAKRQRVEDAFVSGGWQDRVCGPESEMGDADERGSRGETGVLEGDTGDRRRFTYMDTLGLAATVRIVGLSRTLEKHTDENKERPQSDEGNFRSCASSGWLYNTRAQH